MKSKCFQCVNIAAYISVLGVGAVTEKQFMALAELLRMRGGTSQEAARLVLVKGLPTSEAARKTGTTRQAVSNVLASCYRGLDLARRATQDAE